jgi:hypothetical protein
LLAQWGKDKSDAALISGLDLLKCRNSAEVSTAAATLKKELQRPLRFLKWQ